MTLVDELTEQRMIAALVIEPCVLAAADAVEVDDFTDPRNRAIMSAIRNLQCRGFVIEAFEIDAEIRRRDRTNGTEIADMAGLVHIAILLLDTPSYGGKSVLFEHDMAWLRILADRRRSYET